MLWQKLRTIALVTLCGGTLLQATTGCDSVIAPLLSSIVTTVVTGAVSGFFAT